MEQYYELICSNCKHLDKKWRVCSKLEFNVFDNYINFAKFCNGYHYLKLDPSIDSNIYIQALHNEQEGITVNRNNLQEMTDLTSNIIILKQDTINCINNNICPFCKVNTDIDYTLKVGYHTTDREFEYYVLWLSIVKKTYDYVIKIPICNTCKNKFHNKQLIDPSHQVLEYRQGYNMGLADHFNFYNIESVRSMQYEIETVKNKICPNCKLNNPLSTIICDCGYNFQIQNDNDEEHLHKEDITDIYERDKMNREPPNEPLSDKSKFIREKMKQGVMGKEALRQWEYQEKTKPKTLIEQLEAAEHSREHEKYSEPIDLMRKSSKRMVKEDRFSEMKVENQQVGVKSLKPFYRNKSFLILFTIFIILLLFISLIPIKYFFNNNPQYSFFDKPVYKIQIQSSGSEYMLKLKYKNYDDKQINEDIEIEGKSFKEYIIYGELIDIILKIDSNYNYDHLPGIVINIFKNDKAIYIKTLSTDQKEFKFQN